MGPSMGLWGGRMATAVQDRSVGVEVLYMQCGAAVPAACFCLLLLPAATGGGGAGAWSVTPPPAAPPRTSCTRVPRGQCCCRCRPCTPKSPALAACAAAAQQQRGRGGGSRQQPVTHCLPGSWRVPPGAICRRRAGVRVQPHHTAVARKRNSRHANARMGRPLDGRTVAVP